MKKEDGKYRKGNRTESKIAGKKRAGLLPGEQGGQRVWEERKPDIKARGRTGKGQKNDLL